MRFIEKIRNMFLMRNAVKSNIYDSDIFKAGTLRLLEEYKCLLEKENNVNNLSKIKELKFNLNIISDSMNREVN